MFIYSQSFLSEMWPYHFNQKNNNHEHAQEKKCNAHHAFIEFDTAEIKRSFAQRSSSGEGENAKDHHSNTGD